MSSYVFENTVMFESFTTTGVTPWLATTSSIAPSSGDVISVSPLEIVVRLDTSSIPDNTFYAYWRNNIGASWGYGGTSPSNHDGVTILHMAQGIEPFYDGDVGGSLHDHLNRNEHFVVQVLKESDRVKIYPHLRNFGDTQFTFGVSWYEHNHNSTITKLKYI